MREQKIIAQVKKNNYEIIPILPHPDIDQPPPPIPSHHHLQ